jgi:hypothetical protein
MTEDSISLFIQMKRRADAWYRRWLWTLGALMVAVVVIELMATGRL